jgi:hypothetical protein
LSSPLKEAIGKAADVCSEVGTDQPGRIDLEVIEGSSQLQTGSRDVWGIGSCHGTNKKPALSEGRFIIDVSLFKGL